jgi:hypothetical protein
MLDITRVLQAPVAERSMSASVIALQALQHADTTACRRNSRVRLVFHGMSCDMQPSWQTCLSRRVDVKADTAASSSLFWASSAPCDLWCRSCCFSMLSTKALRCLDCSRRVCCLQQ